MGLIVPHLKIKLIIAALKVVTFTFLDIITDISLLTSSFFTYQWYLYDIEKKTDKPLSH